MTDDLKRELKLSQQLVMTPQLQMAIKMLQTSTGDLRSMLDSIVALEPAMLDDPDLLQPSSEELADLEENGIAPWSFDVTVQGSGDVSIVGDPPVARAVRGVLPYVRVKHDADAEQKREALWFARSMRQRARTYELFTATLLAMRPSLATATSPSDIEPVKARELAEAMGMHESTITRVATGIRIENRNGVLSLTSDKRGVHLV